MISVFNLLERLRYRSTWFMTSRCCREYRVNNIPSGPEKSLRIHEQNYPIQVWSFRIAEIRFLHTVQQKLHATALMQLLHLILKFQYIPEPSQPLGRQQSRIQAARNREKWIPSGPEKSSSIHKQNYPIQEWSFRIAEIRFLHTVQQKQHGAALMQSLEFSP